PTAAAAAPAGRQRDHPAAPARQRGALTVARPLVRLQAIFGVMLLALLVLLGRAAEVQVVQGRRWAAQATAARTERVVLPARRGVHLEPVLNRFYPSPGLAGAVIGRVDNDGRGASGLERTLDSLIAGVPGSAVVLKDRAGREYVSPARVIAGPLAGNDVVLTLDAELQEIAQRALDEALRRMDADGGDVVMLARRLEPAEQYGVLRDFGFGAPTGVEFPSEATGRLRPPAQWTRPSAASLAIGYELSVTPLQLAAAYGAIANDGVLLEPTLLKEVRSPAGDMLYRHRPAPVRRVVTADVARRLRELLHGAAQRGTGEEGTLATFQIAAK